MGEAEEVRLFSVEEVDELIPRLELIMERLQRCALELRRSFELLAAEKHCPVGELDVAELVRRWPEKHSIIDDLETLVRAYMCWDSHLRRTAGIEQDVSLPVIAAAIGSMKRYIGLGLPINRHRRIETTDWH